MGKFLQRNFLLYTKDRAGVFFSFLGMFISLVIYILFLRNNLITMANGYPHFDRFIDTWMMAGLISIVAVTTPLNAYGQLISDEQTGRLADYLVNGQLKSSAVNYLYLLTAVIEGALGTGVFAVICFGYLSLKYQYNPFGAAFLATLLFNFGLVVIASLLYGLLIKLIKTAVAYSSLSAIVGTLAGFFSGTYITYGTLPQLIQKLLNYWPGFRVAALTRHIVTKDLAMNLPQTVQHNLGITSNYNLVMLSLGAWVLGLLLLLALTNQRIKH